MSPCEPGAGVAKVVAFVKLGRPQFLIGGFLSFGLGAAAAVAGGARLDARAYAIAQAAITAFQLMTHYANDYFDLEADRANLTPTRWSGGSRILPSGLLSPRVALVASLVFAATGLVLTALGASGAWRGGVATSALLIVVGALAWGYSAPPVRLHSRGLGELTTALAVTVGTPLVAFTAQGGHLDQARVLLLALLPLAGLQFAMLLAIELPDAAGDAAVGKRTLVVRFGTPRGIALYRALLIAVYGSLPLALRAGLPGRVALAAAVAAPVAAWQVFSLGASGAGAAPARWEAFTFRAVAMVAVTTAAELVAFASSATGAGPTQ